MIRNSVTYYTKGHIVLEVNFPEERIKCQWCPFLVSQESNKRHKCYITSEMLVYPFATVGNQCPIVLDDKE